MRKFPIRSIQKRRLYTSKQAAKVIDSCQATIHRMVKNGLPVLDEASRPFYILGVDLFDFVKRKNQKYKVQLQPNEFLCVKCRQAVQSKPENFEMRLTQRRIGESRQILFKGRCEYCSTRLNKYSTERQVLQLMKQGVIDQKHMVRLIDTNDR